MKSTQPCTLYRPLVSEWADGTLDPAAVHQVQRHLDTCPECARLAREFQSLRGLLRGLPPAHTSAGFEASLTARLQAARTRQTPFAHLGQWLYAVRLSPTLLRPALALGAAAAAVGIIAVQQVISIPPQTAQSAAPSAVLSDRSLVQRCVAQQRSEAVAQPLSDPAAQNLASRLDTAAPPAVAGDDSL